MLRWLFRPLVFYPLAIVVAALVIFVGLKPQSWPREPAPAAARLVDNALIYEGEAFNAPSSSPEQTMTVVRDVFGRAQTLRIAQLPGQPPPTPAEQGVRVLMTAADAARLEGKAATVEVHYETLAPNASRGLWVSLQGIGPSDWVYRDTPAEAELVSYELPPQIAVNAIGLRASHDDADEAFGVEITRIRVVPHP